MPDDVAEPLKLIALDAEDLAIVSAHLQDAVVRVGDIAFLPRERRFALAARRFDWQGAGRGHARRRLAALHFERVTGVRSTGIERAAEGAMLNLLAVTFEPGEAPSGHVDLHFSDGGTIRLAVDYVEAQMKDLGPVWEAAGTPAHPGT